MKKKLAIEDWNRKEHFNFFSKFDEPFFGFTVEVDCTKGYENAKKNDCSFFLYYLHKSLMAVNQTKSFRYRIEENEVFEYETIQASATINRPDNTFGFSYIPYHKKFDDFIVEANKEIERVRNSKTLLPATSSENVVHYSSLPWLKFTSLSHARHFAHADSIPKISFGKLFETAGRKKMPYSVHANHALVDGYDVSQHIDLFESLLNG
jgi:chloramphenicol O-acetyltransferase type A